MPVPTRPADRLAQLDDAIASVTWSPDSSRAAVAGVSGGLWLIDVEGRLLHRFEGHADGIFQARWQPDGPVFASVGQDGRVRFWNGMEPEPLEVFDAGTSWVEQLAWSPSGEWLAVGAGRVLHLWHRERGWIHRIPDHPSTVSGIAWRPDSKVVAAACYGGVRLYDPATGKPSGILPWKTSMVSLAWSPDQRWVVAGTQELAIQVWPYPFVEGGELAMSGYAAKVRELAWHHSSRYLATGGGTEAMVWDCGGNGPAGSTPRILEGHTDRIQAIGYQPRGHILATGAADHSVLFWNAGKSSTALRRTELGSPITVLACSPDTRWFLAGTHQGELAVIQAPTS